MPAVLVIPIAMVNSGMLTLRGSQRIGLMAIFALVLVDMVFDVVRTVYALDTYLSSRTNLNGVWTVCEPTIAVVVCAMPHYRSVLCPSMRKASSGQVTFSATWRSQPSVVPLEMNGASVSSLHSRPPHGYELSNRSWA